MKRKARVVTYTLVVILTLSLMSAGLVYGGNIWDKLSDVNSQITDITKQLKKGKAEEKELNEKIKSIENQIVSAESEIEILQKQIDETLARVEAAQADLEAAQADIDRQDDDMSQRIRSMYKSGDTSILEVLLGSENIADFMTNLDMAQRIYDNDVKVLEDLAARYEVLAEKKQALVALQEDLEAQKQAEEQSQAALKVSKSNVVDMKAEVENNNDVLEAQIDALNEEADAISAEIRRLQSTADYIGGEMLWPTSAGTKITSYFGYRIHPILKTKKMHTGIDIGIGTGSNVRAANDGTVMKAEYSSGYGYYVMVDHGGGIVTLYAHNSKLLVSAGDAVTQGQQLAESGSTGRSTGPHLHFEVRVNGEYVDPLGYV